MKILSPTFFVNLTIATSLFWTGVASATVSSTVSGTTVRITGDSSADVSEFSVDGDGNLCLNGDPHFGGLSIMVHSITEFNYNDGAGNDEVVFTGVHAFEFKNLADFEITSAGSLEVEADIEFTSLSATPSLASFVAYLEEYAVITDSSLTLEDGHVIIEARGGGSGAQAGVMLSNANISSSGSIDLDGVGATGDGSCGVVLADGSTVTSSASFVDIDGDAGGSQDDNVGVVVESDCVIFAYDTLTIEGDSANGTGVRNYGGVIEGSVSSDTGDLWISGSGTGLHDNVGLHVSSSASIESNDGRMYVHGSSGGTGSNNYGLFLEGSVERFSTTANGWRTVIVAGHSLYGRGGSGVVISGSNANINTAGGDVHIEGIGSYSLLAHGVQIVDATIHGEDGLSIFCPWSGSHGVYIVSDEDGTGAHSAQISSNADMQIVAQPTTSDPGIHGVLIQGSGGTIRANYGAIDIWGIQVGGANACGVRIEDSTLVSAAAEIDIWGESAGANNAAGIHLDDTARVRSSNNNITVRGDAPNGRAGIYAGSPFVELNAGPNGDIYFTTDEYEFPATVTGSTAYFEPWSDLNGIDVGAATGSVNLSQTEIDYLNTDTVVLTAFGDVNIDDVDFMPNLVVETDGVIEVNELNWDSADPSDVTLRALGEIEGSSSAAGHVAAYSLELESGSRIGSPAFDIMATDLKVVATTAILKEDSVFRVVHVDAEHVIFWDGLELNDHGVAGSHSLHVVFNDSDPIFVPGDVILNSAELSVDAPLFGLGNELTLISKNGTAAIDGTFNGLAEGDKVNVWWTISYEGGSDSNDITLER